MTKNETCLFFAPYRSEKTRRPHPSKMGICVYQIQWPSLPNSISPCKDKRPISLKDCSGCPVRMSRHLTFPQPLLQEEMLKNEG